MQTSISHKKKRCWLYPAPGRGRTPSQGPWAPGRAWGGAGLCYLALLVPVLGPHLLAYIRCWSLRFCVGCLVCLPPGSRPLLWLCGAVSLPLSRGRTWAAPGSSRRFCCEPPCCPILAPALHLSSWLCACHGAPFWRCPPPLCLTTAGCLQEFLPGVVPQVALLVWNRGPLTILVLQL